MKIIIHKKGLLIGLVIVLTILIFFFILDTVNANKMNYGMRIAGISIGGLNPCQTQTELEIAAQNFLEKELFLNYKEFYWQANPEKLGIKIDISATINLAFSKSNILWQVASIFGYNLQPIWQIDEEKLEIYFQENLVSIHQPAQNALLVYNQEKQDFDIIPSKKGIIIDKKKFEKQLSKNINNFQQNDIRLFLIKDEPEVLENQMSLTKEKAKEILANTPIKIIIKDSEIDTIDKEKLLELMEFGLEVEFKDEKLKDYLISLTPLINREPIDAQLTIKNNRVVAFALPRQGIKLEIEDNVSFLRRMILKNRKEILLKTFIIQPKITTDSINNMGITALLAKGVSNFSGSPKSRIHNIKLGAARFNGVLIKSGEEFSFNNILGEIGPGQGYEPELVIKKDKTIPEYGGGLCQVSTTAFRAAINAGLKITQRYAHAFAVVYYNPQGFDATIYPPFPDVRFINNTQNNILIQTKIIDYELIFEFYGSDDGRKVEIDGPYQYDFEEDGSMKAKLFQKVYDKDDKLIIDKIFYSNYKSPDLYPIERNPLE